MSIRMFEQKNVEMFLDGVKIMGTGGGGEADWGRVIMKNDFAHGRQYRIASFDDVENDAFVCSGGIMGSVKALGSVSYEDITAEWEDNFPLIKAIRTMEKLMERKVDYLIPFEAGGLNTPVVMSAAARLNIPVIDGDLVGRSAPETQMASPIGLGIDLYPMPLVDRIGNVNIVMHSDDATYADEVGRYIIVRGGGLGANAHFPMTGLQMKNACIPNSLSRALQIGRAISKDNSIKSLTELCNGHLAFSGRIERLEGEDKGGFYLTNMYIEGSGAFAGKTAKLVNKNETMALWIGDKLVSMFPDMVYMVDPITAKGISTVELKEKLDISLICAPCDERLMQSMQSERGKAAFAAARYGYADLAYRSYRELND